MTGTRRSNSQIRSKEKNGLIRRIFLDLLCMVPVLAHNTLNHCLFRFIRIRIWAMASAIHSREVLIIRVVIIILHFIGIQFTANRQNFRCTTIAAELPLCIQLNQFMIIVAMICACQANAGSFTGVGS